MMGLPMLSMYESLQLLAMVAVPVVAGGLGLIVYRIRSIQNTLDRHDTRLDDHGEKLASTSAQIGQVANLRSDIKDVHGRVDVVYGDVKELRGQMSEVTRTNKMILEHLMKVGAPE